jgi:hypothetical protein
MRFAEMPNIKFMYIAPAINSIKMVRGFRVISAHIHFVPRQCRTGSPQKLHQREKIISRRTDQQRAAAKFREDRRRRHRSSRCLIQSHTILRVANLSVRSFRWVISVVSPKLVTSLIFHTEYLFLLSGPLSGPALILSNDVLSSVA